jgi:hypothetical protein
MSGVVVDAAHGWLAVTRGVARVMVVEVDPTVKGIGALVF